MAYPYEDEEPAYIDPAEASKDMDDLADKSKKADTVSEKSKKIKSEAEIIDSLFQ